MVENLTARRQAAKTVLETSGEDPDFLWSLLYQSQVHPILRRLLKAEVLNNDTLAECILASEESNRMLKRCQEELEPNVSRAKRRRIVGKQSAPLWAGKQSAPLWADTRTITGFLPIGIQQNGLVFRSLTMRERIRLNSVSRNMYWTLQDGCCWDPLHLDSVDCRVLVRHSQIVDNDHLVNTLPKGLLQVTKVIGELMDPEDRMNESVSEDEEDIPVPNPFWSPFKSVCATLERWFPMVKEISLANIQLRFFEELADIRFMHFRDFGFVKVTGCATPPFIFSIHALRDEAPQILDSAGVISENQARQNAQGFGEIADYNETTKISRCDALFLADHPPVFKSGGEFYARIRDTNEFDTVSAQLIRISYKHVWENMRKRFPLHCR